MNTFVRRASWVWRNRGVSFGNVDVALDRNCFVLFRRSFELPSVPGGAPLHVSADGRYQLFVNGRRIGRGPARCDPLFLYYDTYDIAPFLGAGANVIAALVHSYGRDTSWYELARTDWSRAFGCGGFFLQCDIGDVEYAQRIDTDESWRCRVDESWERDTPPGAVGFVEVRDLRKIEVSTSVEFDDSDWEPAVVLVSAGMNQALQPPMVPFPNMVPRDIPFLEERACRPDAQLDTRELSAEGDMLALAEASGGDLSRCIVSEGDALAGELGETAVQLAPASAVSLLYDFGGTVAGHPDVDIEGPAGVHVDLAYSERLREDGRVPVQRPNPITSQNVHRYTINEGRQTVEKFDRAGFRYLQVALSNLNEAASADVRIRNAGVTFTSYPVGERGAFACSDDELNRIWRASAYTLQLCMQDGFEDCPSREQRQWVGDAYVEMLVNFACFGDTRLAAKLIRQVAQSQRRDGMTQMATPGDISARWPVYIVDYCLAWIMTAGDYVMHTGDWSVADDVFPAITRAIGWFERHIAPNGLLTNPPGWIFIDWSEVDRRGACTALNALLIAALQHAAALADHQKARTLANRWRALATGIAAALNGQLWDEQRGVYVDALLHEGRGRRVSQHANAVMIAAGVAPSGRWKRMLSYVTYGSRLVETSTSLGGPTAAFDEERDVVLAQPFFMHYVHRALAAVNRQDLVVENIRERWSPMLTGHSRDTLWEHWHGEESRCHAWSATPAYDLSREVLGVRPLLPGFDRFAVRPAPAGLSWAEGRYPSVRGDIVVAWRLEDGRFVLELETPAGMTADVTLPPDCIGPLVHGPNRPRIAAGRRTTIGGVGPGTWRIEATRTATRRRG